MQICDKPEKATEEKPILLSATQLKDRGWTPTLVKRFLDPPDTTRQNPYYRSGPPMKLYAVTRVEDAELAEDFQQAYAKSKARSQIGKTIAIRKADELIEQVKCLPIMVKRMPLDQLQKRAIRSYNDFHEELSWERGYDYESANALSTPAFLERITVNFIRHELTEYDDNLEEVAGKIGVSEARAIIRHRVYDEITKVYPEYAEECQRQIAYRLGNDTIEGENNAE